MNQQHPGLAHIERTDVERKGSDRAHANGKTRTHTVTDSSVSDLHIHVDSDRVYISGVVRDATAREQLLESCRRVAGAKEVIDGLQVDASVMSGDAGSST